MTGRQWGVAVVLGVMVVGSSYVAGIESAHEQRVANDHTAAILRRAQIAGCERGKKDREDNAAAWAAHRRYIRAVLKASSVKGDVKDAGAKALATYDVVVPSLKSRTGKNLDCAHQGGGDK